MHEERMLGLTTGMVSPFGEWGIEACSSLSEESFFCWALRKLNQEDLQGGLGG